MKSILNILLISFLPFQLLAQETRTISLEVGGEELEVQVEVIDGRAILQGHIDLGPIEEFESTGRGGTSISKRAARWNNGIVPYEIAEGHPLRSMIMQAINDVNRQTNIRLVPRTSRHSDYISISNNSSLSRCASYWIGRKGGRQVINVTNCPYDKGSLIHELCHAIGMWHEHQHPQRDTHIEILDDNIIERAKAQYAPYTDRAWARFYNASGGRAATTYDPQSIMHYNPRQGSNGRGPAFRARPGKSIDGIGQRERLSRGDIATLNMLASNSASTGSPTGVGSQKSTSSGNSSWQIENLQSFNIQYEVELVPQMTGVSGWAAGAAMIVGWRDEICINPEEIARGVGYWSAYYNNGLPPDDTRMFEVWGLQQEAPMSYTIQGLRDLISSYGPLWVATAELAPRIRVISGISGDGTPDGTILTIQDPWQRGMRRFRTPNNGSTYTETFTEFMRKQAELARSEFDIAAPIYIAHN